MGLDIAFNRAAAIAAGMELVKALNGTDEEITRAKEIGGDDDYVKYLERKDEFIKVPGTEMLVHNGGVDAIVVRANKWGRVYGPLTTWLKANNIEWSEF